MVINGEDVVKISSGAIKYVCKVILFRFEKARHKIFLVTVYFFLVFYVTCEDSSVIYVTARM